MERADVPIPTEPPYTAYTGNLSFEATEADIGDFFVAAGCGQVGASLPFHLEYVMKIVLQISSIRLVSDREGKFKGFAYVEFGTVDDLKKALAQSGAQVGGRPIRVSVAEPRSFPFLGFPLCLTGEWVSRKAAAFRWRMASRWSTSQLWLRRATWTRTRLLRLRWRSRPLH
jgi:RNA recognition motif-containing protein